MTSLHNKLERMISYNLPIKAFGHLQTILYNPEWDQLKLANKFLHNVAGRQTYNSKMTAVASRIMQVSVANKDKLSATHYSVHNNNELGHEPQNQTRVDDA